MALSGRALSKGEGWLMKEWWGGASPRWRCSSSFMGGWGGGRLAEGEAGVLMVA